MYHHDIFLYFFSGLYGTASPSLYEQQLPLVFLTISGGYLLLCLSNGDK